MKNVPTAAVNAVAMAASNDDNVELSRDRVEPQELDSQRVLPSVPSIHPRRSWFGGSFAR